MIYQCKNSNYSRLNTIIYYIVCIFALGKRHKRCICYNKVNNHPARGHRSVFSTKKQDAEQEDHEFRVSKDYKEKL